MGVTRYTSNKLFEKCEKCENRNGQNCKLGGECTYKRKNKKHDCPLNKEKRELNMPGNMLNEVKDSLQQAGYQYDEKMSVSDNIGSAMLGEYAKGYNKGFEDFAWHPVSKDHYPQSTGNILVTVEETWIDKHDDEWMSKKYVCSGYFYKGEFFMNGNPLGWGSPHTHKVIAMADYPRCYESNGKLPSA